MGNHTTITHDYLSFIFDIGDTMPLRPVNAIFIEQKQQFIVVYQQGKLWQLPRMKLDMSAWRYRKPFTGNKSALILARNQHIADTTLAQKLPTHQLPNGLHGINLPRFENWWRQNGFDWLNNRQNDNTNTQNKDIQNDNTNINTKANISPTADISNHKNTQPRNQPNVQSNPQSDNQSDNIFDSMLADLEADLLK